jgi:hypothetical protein
LVDIFQQKVLVVVLAVILHPVQEQIRVAAVVVLVVPELQHMVQQLLVVMVV